MQILTAAQIKQWDKFTIEQKKITSIDLMETAATACLQWLQANELTQKPFHIFCGKGNNGGDGLAIARLLSKTNKYITVHILELGKIGTPDFQANLIKLHETTVEIKYIQSAQHFHEIENEAIIIDALFGIGMNKTVDGFTAQLIEHINGFENRKISIDIPSGMFADGEQNAISILKADDTISFQCFKIAFLLVVSQKYIGRLHILDIGLHTNFLQTISPSNHFIDASLAKTIYKPRNNFSHKGMHGHALIVAGSYGKMGAAILSTKACIRTGAGVSTALIPTCGYQIMQTAIPEAMVITSGENYLSSEAFDLKKVTAIGIGPGIDTQIETIDVVKKIICLDKPMVIDADALNVIAENKDLLKLLKPNTIITPHPKEFDRLFGKCENEYVRMKMAIEKANQLQIIIVLKGHFTIIAMPGQQGYFNTTGNAGMAKGGSGDVLTGIITALLAQNYATEHAATLGVYLHGLSADIALKNSSLESLIGSDIIENIGNAFNFFLIIDN